MSLTDPRTINPVLSALKITQNENIIFIKENPLADSNFIITHLLKQILYEKSRICFLLMHHDLEHYQNVGKKLGYDLKQAIERNNVKIVDPVEKMIENIGENQFDHSLITSMKDLFLLLRKKIEDFEAINTTQPIYVIIDDISHYLDLGIELREIIQFVNCCINLISKSNISIVMNSHVNVKNDQIIAKSIEHVCDVMIEVSQLKTGKSRDVTGLISVYRDNQINHYHYKAFDRGIKTFQPGDVIL